MTERIQSYQDLLDEKKRLETLLRQQKEAFHQDIREIKEDIRPVMSTLSFAGKLVTREKGNILLNAGANTVINLLVRKLLLARAGWFTKWVVPFLLKNYSSHIIADNKQSIMDTLSSWIGKKNANGKEHTREPG